MNNTKKSKASKNRPAYNIPCFIQVFDSAGQLVHSQDGKGYLDTAKSKETAQPVR